MILPKYLNCKVCQIAIFISKTVRISIEFNGWIPKETYCKKCLSNEIELVLNDHRI